MKHMTCVVCGKKFYPKRKYRVIVNELMCIITCPQCGRAYVVDDVATDIERSMAEGDDTQGCAKVLYNDKVLSKDEIAVLQAMHENSILVPREMFEGWADALADAYDIIPRDKWPIRLRLANMSNSLTALLSEEE